MCSKKNSIKICSLASPMVATTWARRSTGIRYPIPDGVDLSNYPSVVIWCAEFGVLISPADLTL
jgi:hypothetical protein